MPPKASTFKLPSVPKSIFVFCDGTSNDDNTDVKKGHTNVFSLFQCVNDKVPDETPRLVFYQQGLGTSPKIGKGEVKGLVPDVSANLKDLLVWVGIGVE
ncbi:hypothetical protein M7I_2989 [Glarea lozoyensis 74030]|uniref:T6SS Phospholipase effector Tle1-like catalytic domain-containing protein n=1 Tax=Glarea lozoyensis (strain ATCC 74030 / MF5533) TaxID=1104152 RepID=H0EK96_GLAL7|nr:hypothetical protein M7I_2989 [Glarea lozoyensis 74030]